MGIYNVAKHLSCFCYEGKDNPLIEVKKMNRMEMGEAALPFNEIVLVASGKVRLTLSNNMYVELSKEQFVFLPAGIKLHYKAIAKSHVLIMRLSDNIQLCYSYSLDRYYDKVRKIEKQENLAVMEVNTRIQHFATGLIDVWKDGLKCRFFLQAKIHEFLTLVQTYYPENDVCRLFYSILSSDTTFSNFVRANYLKYPTVSKLAHAMKMSTQQFTRHFNNVFGEAPYGWMQREKARLIYGEICRSDKPIKEIAAMYGFTVPANFNRFCKTAFGINPGEIRKRKSKEIS